MSIFSVSEGDFSRFTVVTEPKRVFKSSIDEDNPDNIVLRSKFKKFTSRNFQINLTNINGYLRRVNGYPQLTPDSSSFTVKRQTIDNILTEDEVTRRFGGSSKDFVLPYLDEFFQKKWMIQDILEPYYGGSTDSWSYPNYHSINFYALSEVGGGALLYPNIGGRYNPPNDEFTIDFRIKINHRVNSTGTILHFPNNFSLFVRPNVTRDEFNNIKAYDLILKKGTNSNTVPESSETNCVMNCLQLNTWHRVTIRQNASKVDISVSGIDTVSFSSSFSYNDDSGILVLGSLCELSDPDSVYQRHSLDFHKVIYNKRASQTLGIEEFQGVNPNQNNSPFYSWLKFTNPLYAEIHDFSIHRGYLDDETINASAETTLWSNDCIFYLGPYFNETSGIRRSKYKIGSTEYTDKTTGILRLPVVAQNLEGSNLNGTTTEPFNTWLAYGTGGHYINIENFLSDIANISKLGLGFCRPRIIGMSKSLTQNFNSDDQYRLPNDYSFKNDQNVVLRNLLILPCDDGGFKPDWNSDLFKYSPENNNTKILHEISLKFEFNEFRLSNKNIKGDVSINEYGVTPAWSLGVFQPNKGSRISSYVDRFGFIEFEEDMWLIPVVEAIDTEQEILEYSTAINSLTFPKPLFNITNDNSSNQIVIFDISNLFYGKFIKPGTFIIKDPQLAGSSDDNPVGITIKDDGMGGLYRADCNGTHAVWNTVGRIFYNEGLVVIKNPHLFFFGKGSFEVSFSGEQNVHTLKIEVVAPQNALNRSSNDPAQQLLPSNDPSDKKSRFVYITGLNFHDKNYNVVAKTQLAQPIVKRHEDKIMFRVQMDF